MLTVATVDLTCCGRTWRAATRAIEGYPPGLTWPSIVDGIDIVPSVPGDQTVSLEAVFDGLDVAASVADGWSPVVADATVRVVTVDDDGDEQQVLLSITGPARGVQWGDPERPPGWVAFSVVQQPWSGDAALVRGDHVVSMDTWPGMQITATPGFSAAKGGDGKPYPWVWGAPGADGGDGSGTPAYVVEIILGPVAWRLLICDGPSAAPRVRIRDHTGATEVFDVENMLDARGNTVGTVYIRYAATIDLDPDQEFWCEWFDGPARMSQWSPSSSTVVSAIGDMLLRGGAILDLQSLVSAEARLSADFGGYVNDADVTAWDLIAKEILGIYPLTIRRDGDRVQVLSTLPPLRDEVCARIVEGPGWSRIAPAQVEREIEDVDAYTTLRYAFGTAEVSMDHQQPPAVQTGRARALGSTLGRVVTADYVPDQESALNVLSSIWQTTGRPLYVTRYAVDAAQWGWLVPGDAVELTDSGIGLDAEVCMVVERSWSQSDVEEILLCWWGG